MGRCKGFSLLFAVFCCTAVQLGGQESTDHESGAASLRMASIQWGSTTGSPTRSPEISPTSAKEEAERRWRELKFSGPRGRAEGATWPPPAGSPIVYNEDDEVDEDDEGAGGPHCSCGPSQFLCRSNCLCIPASWRCDGAIDCVESSEDEEHCPWGRLPLLLPTPSPRVPIPDPGRRKAAAPGDDCQHLSLCPSGQCIHRSRICDGFNDCGDGWDEQKCDDDKAISATVAPKKKKSSPTLPTTLRKRRAADRRTNAGRKGRDADIIYVATATLIDLSSNENPLKRRSARDVSLSVDHHHDQLSEEVDYEEGEGEGDSGERRDEVTCSCDPGEFLCRSSCFCVPDEFHCDTYVDCEGNAEDEADCATDTWPERGDEGSEGDTVAPEDCHNILQCPSGKCIYRWWICDGENDCGDGWDEDNCGDPEGAAFNCTESDFICKNGQCIKYDWQCDGDNDCQDASDEMNCTPTT